MNLNEAFLSFSSRLMRLDLIKIIWGRVMSRFIQGQMGGHRAIRNSGGYYIYMYF